MFWNSTANIKGYQIQDSFIWKPLTPHLAPIIDEIVEDLGKQKFRKILVGGTIKEKRCGWLRYEDLVEEGAKLDPIPPISPGPDDVCQLFYTSGTTGEPKMIPHTHTNYGNGHEITAKTWIALEEKDVIWNVSDIGWPKYTWSSLYIPLIAGATIYVHTMSRFDSQKILRALETDPVTVLCASLNVFRMLVQQPLQDFSFRSLRHCVSGGEPVNPKVMEIWKSNTGLSIHEGYGQSESTIMCASLKDMEIRPGSMGKPCPGYHMEILDDGYNPVENGTEGSIAVNLQERPPGLFQGYHNDPAKTEYVFKNGYYFTGDRGYFDNDGYLWFVGRDDDVILSDGFRINPFEVESSLLEHPCVVEAAVIGVPDQIRSQTVKAFVVLTDDAEGNVGNKTDLKKELQNHVRNRIAPYKYPREIDFVKDLPKTISGKVKRYELRLREQQA